MTRTVLGWRCRWGSGRSLPTSYTSPQAANKPLIVFPIHTDRGRHCLNGFTPCFPHGPWFTPPKNISYLFCRSQKQCPGAWREESGSHERSMDLWSYGVVRTMGPESAFNYSCELFKTIYLQHKT